MGTFDAIVVGAGPAGSTTARELASAGARVLIVDRAEWPRYKACGGGVPLRAERMLPFPIDSVVEDSVSRIEMSARGRMAFTSARAGRLRAWHARSLRHAAAGTRAAAGAELRTGTVVRGRPERGARIGGTGFSGGAGKRRGWRIKDLCARNGDGLSLGVGLATRPEWRAGTTAVRPGGGRCGAAPRKLRGGGDHAHRPGVTTPGGTQWLSQGGAVLESGRLAVARKREHAKHSRLYSNWLGAGGGRRSRIRRGDRRLRSPAGRGGARATGGAGGGRGGARATNGGGISKQRFHPWGPLRPRGRALRQAPCARRGAWLCAVWLRVTKYTGGMDENRGRPRSLASRVMRNSVLRDRCKWGPPARRGCWPGEQLRCPVGPRCGAPGDRANARESERAGLSRLSRCCGAEATGGPAYFDLWGGRFRASALAIVHMLKRQDFSRLVARGRISTAADGTERHAQRPRPAGGWERGSVSRREGYSADACLAAS